MTSRAAAVSTTIIKCKIMHAWCTVKCCRARCSPCSNADIDQLCAYRGLTEIAGLDNGGPDIDGRIPLPSQTIKSMSPLHISNSTQNSTNCPKLVIIHITKPHSFIVLYSLHSLYPSVYVYMNMRITMVMLLRHTGHVSTTVTRFLARQVRVEPRKRLYVWLSW